MAVERPIDLNNQVHVVIRAEILEGRIAPGTRLNVGRLAERLDVSPTPVKNALARLATEGLVEFPPRGGAFVSRLTVREIEEIIEIREMIELFAARQVLESGTDADWDQLESLAESLRTRVYEDGSIDFANFSADDIAFHRVLVGLAGNQRLTQLYEAQHVYTLVARAHYASLPTRPSAPPEGGTHHVYTEHMAIVAALRARDPAALDAAIRDHLSMVSHFVRSAAELAQQS